MITAKEIKDWVNQFPDGYEIELEMDCLHGTARLVTYYNQSENNLELGNPAQPIN